MNKQTTMHANQLGRTEQKFLNLNKNKNDINEQQQWTLIYTYKSHIEMPVSTTVLVRCMAVLGSYSTTNLTVQMHTLNGIVCGVLRALCWCNPLRILRLLLRFFLHWSLGVLHNWFWWVRSCRRASLGLSLGRRICRQ